MIKVMFVCLGNICRSPMAEFVFKKMVQDQHLEDQFIIVSSATSREEIGNPVHKGTVRKLSEVGIKCDGKTSIQFRKSDYASYDYILCMETNNIKSLLRIIGADPESKIHRLLDYTTNPRDIADPWYTGNFDATYNDVKEGCEAFLNDLYETHVIRPNASSVI